MKTKTAALFPSGLSLNLASFDAEEMKEQSLFWSYEHKQFGRGSFHGKIAGFHTSRLQLTLSHRSVGFFARGGLPEKTTIISVPLSRVDSLYYRGQLMGDCQVLALKHTEELELYTSLPSTMLTIAVSSALLERQALAITGNPLAGMRCQERLLINPKEYRKRADHLVSLLQSLQSRNPELCEVEEQVVEKEILETILMGVIPSGLANKMPDRLYVAKKAEKYIRNNLRTSFSISELCRIVGTSERTMHLGFNERFGVSPKAYHQIMRLNRVHQELLLSKSSKTVSDIAIDWGFHHPGRFPEQYRRMFGELPSETRKKSILDR